MSQHDFDIANDTGHNVRLDLTAALQALATLSSGATAPATTFAHLLWYDTANKILKKRDAADAAWIDVFKIDASGFLNLSASGTELAQVNQTLAAIVMLGTKGTYLPIGTTAQRPSGTPTAAVRYNSDLLQMEMYANGGWQKIQGFTGYTAICGAGAYCTHANLAAALADSAVVAGSRILVCDNQTINTTISVAKANITIDFLPGVTFTKGSADPCITFDAAGTRLKGGRFSGFTTAITISSTFQYNFVTECRFASCTTDVNEADSAPNNIVTNNITE